MSHFYVTRDPLKGVEEVQIEGSRIEEMLSGRSRLWFRVGRRAFEDWAIGEGMGWHRTADGANRRMRSLRALRIAQLQREIAKLKKLQKEGKR